MVRRFARIRAQILLLFGFAVFVVVIILLFPVLFSVDFHENNKKETLSVSQIVQQATAVSIAVL